MKYVALRYGVTFGKGDSSDWIDWDLQLTDEEEKIYDHAIANKLPLNELPELEGALRRAYEEIEDEEISMGIDNGDEYTMECQGEAEVDPDATTIFIKTTVMICGCLLFSVPALHSGIVAIAS